MRVANWNPAMYDEQILDTCGGVLIEAAKAVRDEARRLCPVGTISRPIYKTGKYAGAAWTARDAGQLKRSIRITTKLSKYGRELKRIRNVRVYAGHYLAYYASIVEFAGKPFMRPSLSAAHSKMMGVVTSANSGPSTQPPKTGGSFASVLNWKPNPGREKFLDEWQAARK